MAETTAEPGSEGTTLAQGREELAPKAFLERLKAVSRADGTAEVDGVLVKPDAKGLDIDLLRLSIRRLVLNDCALPKCTVTCGSTSGSVIELAEVASPNIYLFGGDSPISLIKLTAVHIGEMAIAGVAGVESLYLNGRIRELTCDTGVNLLCLHGISIERLTIKGREPRLIISEDAPPLGSYGYQPLRVTEYIVTDQPALAATLHLACPNTPIFYTGEAK